MNLPYSMIKALSYVNQMLIGMAQWACTIGHLDISFAVSSLSQFSAAPWEGHLQLAIYMFGYLKKHPNHNLVIDSGPLIIPEEFKSSTFQPDFWKITLM